MKSAVNYGMLPEAVHIPQEQLLEENGLPKDKKIILYCTRGLFSKEKASELREMGYQAYSLSGRLYRLAVIIYEGSRRELCH